MKKIVILGAGFGGLRAAVLIVKKIKSLGLIQKYEIVLVDKNEHQTYTPLLYEVATTSKETADLSELHSVATYRIRKILGNTPVRFIQAEIEALDLVEGNIRLKNGVGLNCDFLIIALGSETNYFGIKGLKENSSPLKTFADAIAIRDKIWNLVSGGADDVKIVIGGGGPTGVELAGELKVWCGEMAKEFKKCRLSVTIVEGQPTVLSGMDSRVINLTKKRLTKLNVALINGRRVVEALRNEIVLDDGKRIPFDVFAWAGGVKSPDVISRLPLENEAHGRILTRGEMECLPQTPELKLSMMVYGLGDSICFYDPLSKKPIPAVARAALVQADVVAHNIVEEIKKIEDKNYLPRPVHYVPKEYPYIVPVGGKYAIAKFGTFVISGFFGWVLKGLVELNYLLSIMPPLLAIKTWLKGLWIFAQNDRLG